MENKKEQGVVDVNETLSKSEAFFVKYKKAVVFGVVALIVVIAAFFMYANYYVQPREDKASTALAKGQDYFGQEAFDKALNGDGVGFPGLLAIINDHSGTKAANLAKLYAGLCYARQDKWEEAVKYLEDYSPADDQMVGPSAIAALADAYANTKQIDKAITTFKKAADKADKRGHEGVNNSLAPSYRVKAAVLLESQGKKEEALAIYKEVKEKYVFSSVVRSGEIDKYIEHASR